MRAALRRTPGVAAMAPTERRGDLALTSASRLEGSEFTESVRSRLPDGALVGGAAGGTTIWSAPSRAGFRSFTA